MPGVLVPQLVTVDETPQPERPNAGVPPLVVTVAVPVRTVPAVWGVKSTVTLQLPPFAARVVPQVPVHGPDELLSKAKSVVSLSANDLIVTEELVLLVRVDNAHADVVPTVVFGNV